METRDTFPVLTVSEMRGLSVPVGDLLGEMWDAFPGKDVMELLARHGGVPLYLGEDANLVARAKREGLSISLLRWLRDRCFDSELTLPRGPFASTPLLLAQIRFLHAQGVPLRKIALRCNCHERSVNRHVARLRKAGFLTLYERPIHDHQ